MHGTERGEGELVIDRKANKGLREHEIEGEEDCDKRRSLITGSLCVRLGQERLRVERSCLLERQRTRVGEEEEQERRGRCIHLDRLS